MFGIGEEMEFSVQMYQRRLVMWPVECVIFVRLFAFRAVFGWVSCFQNLLFGKFSLAKCVEVAANNNAAEQSASGPS